MPRIKSTPHHISALTPDHVSIMRRSAGHTPPPPSPAGESPIGPPIAEDLSVLAAAAAAAPSHWRLSVHRRSFDHMTEEFTRLVEHGAGDLWDAAIAALKEHLLAAKAHNDEYLSNEGACDKVSVNLPTDADGLGPPMPFCGRNHVPLEDWLAGLAAGGPTALDAVMGSSHHNAPQWFITCGLENPDTAVTVILMRSIPELRFEDIVYPPKSYQFTEHAADLHAAVRFIAQHTGFDGPVTVTADGGDPVIMTLPHYYSADYSALDGTPLPLFLEGREGTATVTVALSRTI